MIDEVFILIHGWTICVQCIPALPTNGTLKHTAVQGRREKKRMRARGEG